MLERRLGQQLAAALLDPAPMLGVERCDIRADRPDAVEVRRPPLVVRRERKADRQRRRPDVAQAGVAGDLDERTLTRPGPVGLAGRGRVDLLGGLPEHRQRRRPPGEVPDAGGHDSTRLRHPSHLAQPGDGVAHEVHDELREGRVEGVVVERQGLGGGLVHVDTGEAVADGRDERRRRVDRPDALGSASLHQGRGQDARTAPHVEDPVTTAYGDEVDELLGEWPGVTAHEPLVRVGGDVEAHGPSVAPSGGLEPGLVQVVEAGVGHHRLQRLPDLSRRLHPLALAGALLVGEVDRLEEGPVRRQREGAADDLRPHRLSGRRGRRASP